MTISVYRDGPAVVVLGGSGPPGPQGPPGLTSITRVADVALSGNRVVRQTDTGCNYASADTPSDANVILGITTGAVAEGNTATIQVASEMTDSSWAWTLGPVYLGLLGNLSQTPPALAFVRQIGFAVGPTTLRIQLQDPVLTP